MNKTMNEITAWTRLGLEDVIINLGKSTMIDLMDSFKDSKYGGLGYRSIMASYGQCSDSEAIGYFLDKTASQLMPVSTLIEHVQLVAPADRSVINWFISKGYYVENAGNVPVQVNPYPYPTYPVQSSASSAPPMTIPPLEISPLQQAVVTLNAKLDEAFIKLKTANEKIDALTKSLRTVEVENVELRTQVTSLQNRNKEQEKMLMEMENQKKAAATVTPTTSTTNFTGAKKYLHELNDIEMKWIHELLYSHREAMNIGIYMNTNLDERRIQAMYGNHISQMEVVKHMLYELSQRHDLTIRGLVDALRKMGLVAKSGDVAKKFNV
ncbi:hypothetical protein BNJ_00444 [Kaumoebavirus]|uniref:hypothetical protein n=1 Tax=Kaumoebavirus TaxID=1859492 RepID=UPI0009C2892F|nr:hypothetical protein BNJ_00444 [Kaumoebavirus]ARA72256.1 hypothetical protein BNJ_00444 [Kaumoebavirus]